MSIYTDAELELLRAKGTLGRLGTIGPDGGPQVRPVAFLVHPDTGAIDIPGRHNPSTQKWRNVGRNPKVSLVVDDTGSGAAFEPRALEIRGTAELLPDEQPTGAFAGAAPGVIRIYPRRILSYVGGEQNNRTVG